MNERPLPDWDTLAFGLTETDATYSCRGDVARDPVWDTGTIRPWANLSWSPAAAALSYGFGIFEGLKAFRHDDGRIVLFRPEMNAARFARSAERLMMAPFPASQFVDAASAVVDANRRFVPPSGRGSFYLRPMQHAHEPRLGSAPCREFEVTIYGCPVGPVKAHSTGGIRIRIVEQARVAPGGTGSAKAMGNYAGGLLVAAPWKAMGFDDVLYLDAREARWVTETSGANLFAVLRSGRLVTPPLDDQILAGITRDSVITAARQALGLVVEERPLSVDELLSDVVEVFCTGTAWTVRSVGEIAHRERTVGFPQSEVRAQLWEIISGVQTGRRDDTFGWTREVPCR